MKKNISINLQGIIFHIEDDGYDVLSRYLQEVKAHFASYQGHEEIVADIEGRIAELFSARLSVSKQVITLADVEEMTAKMGRVRDFQSAEEEDEDEPAVGSTGRAAGPTPPFGQAADGQPRRLYRDLAHRKVAGVCAGLAQYFMINPLVIRLAFLALVLLPNLFRHRFPFPGVGIFDRDFDLPGLVVLLYIILWVALPKRADAPAPIDTLDFGGSLTGRKLFRDTDGGKVGGVAAGLAAYFRTDVVLIRVLFLISLFLGGSGLIVYLILWVVVPEARTVSERMQMRGDAVTLSGIDNSLRGSALDGDVPPAPNRPVGTFLEGAARQARPAVGFLGTLIRWAAGVVLIFTGGSWLLTVLGFAGAALGIISADSVIHTDNNFRFGDESFNSVMHNAQPWGVVAATLAVGVPALALMLLGVRLLLRRSVLGRSGGLVLLALWLLGIVGTAAAGGQIFRDTRTRASYTTVRRLAAMPGPGIVLDSRNMDDFMEQARLRLALADSGAAPYVEEDYQARGRTQSSARLTAQQSILYTITQQDSTITFDQGLTLRENAPYRGQKLTLTLHLPLDKTYRLMPLFLEKLDDEDFTNGRRPHDNQPHRARFTRAGKFTCLDCPPTTDDEEDNADNNKEDSDNDGVVNLDLNGNKMQVRVNTDGDEPTVRFTTKPFGTNPATYGTGRKTLNDPGTFSEVETRGALRLVLRQGDTYKVEAAGRQQDLDDLRLTTSGDRLVARQGGRGSLFSGFNFSGHPILVTVTLPRLQYLKLSGACQADVSGFHDEALRLEATGASVARLDVRVPSLSLDLAGACQAELRGTANELAIDASGACEVKALGLQAKRANIDLSGASQANVRASEELKVDLGGGSQVRYAGHPARIEKDLSGGSSLEAVKE
ncbi:GIN domain-containing protein [Hymenobacter psoromatis]|uniref:GIN domain-containing protein n=1 Tax=Hymenobacter psoromatis TaxID=1484116 RepID=UPI001CC0AE67|nr:PspC domain-containing protein [Hymenobacter psoromatis]